MAGPLYQEDVATRLLNALAAQPFAIRASYEVRRSQDIDTKFDIIGTTNHCGNIGTIVVEQSVHQTNIRLMDVTGRLIGNGTGNINLQSILFSMFINRWNVSAKVGHRFVEFTENPYDHELNYYIRRPVDVNSPKSTELLTAGGCIYATMYRRESAIVVGPTKNCPLAALGSIIAAALGEYYCIHKMPRTPIPNRQYGHTAVRQIMENINLLRIRPACRDMFGKNSEGVDSFRRLHFDLYEEGSKRSVLVVEVNRYEVNFFNSIAKRLFYSYRTDGSNNAIVYLENGEELGSYQLGDVLKSTASIVGVAMPYFRVVAREVGGFGCRKDQMSNTTRHNLDIVAAIAMPRVVARLDLEDFTVRIHITNEQPNSKSKILLLAYCIQAAIFYYKLPEQVMAHTPYIYGSN